MDARTRNRRKARHLIQDMLHPDSIGMIRRSDEVRYLVCRWGYFYRHGRSAEDYAKKVHKLLKDHLFDFDIPDFGDHWAPFRGGASIANSSHFFVTINIK